VPTALRCIFPLYLVLRLRLRTGLDYGVPPALEVVRFAPLRKAADAFRNSLKSKIPVIHDPIPIKRSRDQSKPGTTNEISDQAAALPMRYKVQREDKRDARIEAERATTPGMTPPQVPAVRIEAMVAGDWGRVRPIYEEGIASGNATFETSAPAWASWDAKHFANCRLVARRGVEVIGWAALSHVSSRRAYRGVAEVSVYIAGSARGQGIASELMSALVEASEAAGIWTLQAGIFEENTASLALHEKHGFRRVGMREKIGCLNGQWRDVVLMERRSKKVGV
jgi:L-amino acid N-acyltransferase YncA